jgi:hypothetical protein
MGLDEVSAILDRERVLLTRLLERVGERRRVEPTSTWRSVADSRVEAVLDELRHMELLRAIEVDVVAAELGMEAGPSLAQLAELAPAPLDQHLRDQRATLLGLATRIRQRTVEPIRQ